MSNSEIAQKTNLLGLSLPELESFCAGIGEKSFRAKQLARWLHKSGVSSFDQMTDLAKTFRAKLPSVACVETLSILSDHTSSDGTRKWLFNVGQGNAVESVYIPETSRGTLCVSSQAGCAVNCRFCSTGRQGFSRNLNAAEIVSQLWLANRLLADGGLTRISRRIDGDDSADAYQENDAAPTDRIVSNVVMMGMGEPLLNYDAVVPALQLMLDDHAYGLSRRRVTVSTSGVVPMMDRLSQDCPVALAVSLHAPNDTLRDELVPLNKKYPLKALLDGCLRYLKYAPRDFITFEYVMLDGVNDQNQHAKGLADIAAIVPCKFNLIPFNPFPESGLRRSSNERIKSFVQQLSESGVVTTVRKTRGDDIDAACGQLAGEVMDRTRVKQRVANQQPISFLKKLGGG